MRGRVPAVGEVVHAAPVLAARVPVPVVLLPVAGRVRRACLRALAVLVPAHKLPHVLAATGRGNRF